MSLRFISSLPTRTAPVALALATSLSLGAFPAIAAPPGAAKNRVAPPAKKDKKADKKAAPDGKGKGKGKGKAGEDTPAAIAARKKKEGDQAMQEKRYADALAAYEAAYAQSPEPALLYNRARAEELSEHFPEALGLFEQFAEKAPPELRAKVPKLDELMQSVRERVAVIEIKVDVPGSAVKLRGLSVGTSPLPAPLRVPTGPATVDVAREGYLPWSRELTLPGGKPTLVDATLVPVVKPTPLGAVAESAGNGPPPEPTSGKPLTSRWWFWTGIGVGVAGGIALTAALLTERDPGKGTIAPGQVTAGLVAF